MPWGINVAVLNLFSYCPIINYNVVTGNNEETVVMMRYNIYGIWHGYQPTRGLDPN